MVSSWGLPGAQGTEALRGRERDQQCDVGLGWTTLVPRNAPGAYEGWGWSCVWGRVGVLESSEVPRTLKKMKTCQSRVKKVLGVERCMMTHFFPPFPCISGTV